MLQPNTTDKESKLFTGRSSIISSINNTLSKKHIAALLAPSGYGRNSILKHFAAKPGHIYIDLRKLSLSPENLAVDLIGTICFYHLAKQQSELLKFQSIEHLKELNLPKPCKDILSTIDNELQKIKPDQQLLLTSAFSFAEQYAASENRKTTILLNNFDELLKLNNFSQVKDVLELFFTTIKSSKHASFVVTSSAVQVMKSLLAKYVTDVLEIPPLDLSETRELFEKCAGKTDDRIIKEAYRLSAGLPLVVKMMALRFKGEQSNNTQKNITLIKYILLSELATTTSQSYFYCSKLFTNSLDRARGASLLKTILKVVSQNKPLRLTEIARLIHRSGPVTKSLLERLIEVDLIAKDGNTFDFANPVLKTWCRLMFSNIEFNEIPDEKSLEQGGLL
jgi:hypothetical protein